MSQTPDQPGTPETPETAGTPGTPAPPPATPPPHDPAAPPTQQWPTAPAAAAAAAPAAPAAGPRPGPAKPSMWREAVSSTGGTVAVIVAGAALSLVALLFAGLVAFGLARHFDGGHGHAVRAGGSQQAPMPDRMGPGERGPQQMPPGQQGRGPSDLPGLGLGGQGLGLAGGALHGEAVIPGEGSATRAVLFQRGEVTDVSADKLTVKSTDGFSATYTIGADSQKRLKDKVSTLAKGDQVMVLATKGDATTLQILKSGRSSGPTT